MDGYPDELRVAPAGWPEQCRATPPGDLGHFVPQGFGLGAPAIVTPYGGPAQDSFYGFDKASPDPLLNGPLTESRGGTLYFDDDTDATALLAAIQIMGVYRTRDYAAFAGTSADSVSERYLDQLRLVTTSALASVFGATSREPPPEQSLDAVEAILAFVAAQKARWADGRYSFSSKLAGTAGGDGDWAKESLAFGFHVENTYWGIYRVWSRPWLVTK